MRTCLRPALTNPNIGANMGRIVNHRYRKILLSVVTEYIATGEPVGSRTLARKFGIDLSAASIRNVLSDLEEAGFLQQPHPSAGRVPTDAALRLFIDTLVETRALEPDDATRLQQRFSDAYDASGDPLRETGKLLAELSGAAGVVALPGPGAQRLTRLRFVRIRETQLLAVLVFENGSVENRFIDIAQSITDAELATIHNMLDETLEGRTLGEVRELVARDLASGRANLDSVRERAIKLAASAAASIPDEKDVLIEGQRQLLELPEYGDVERMKRLVRALEDREQLIALLDRTLTAGSSAVYVGRETGDLGEGELSLVVAPYKDHGTVAGAVAVLGPTRMDYSKVVPLVDASAAAVSDALSKGRGRP